MTSALQGSRLQQLGALLTEVRELGEVAQDQDDNHLPSFDPLVARARNLGITLEEPPRLGALRSALEDACREPQDDASDHALAAHLLSNPEGIPGDGP